MKKNILFLLIAAMMLGMFPTNIYAMRMKGGSTAQKQKRVLFAVGDKFVKKYRRYAGKLQYRLWNKTKRCWAPGSTWKDA